MQKFLLLSFVAVLLAACSGGGVQNMNVLNIDDLQKDYRASKETARSKYQGKEFVVLGKAGSPLGEYALKSTDGKYFYYDVRASEPGAMNCMVPIEERSKFDNIAEGSVIAVKGTIYINEGSFEMRPCTRDFRDAK